MLYGYLIENFPRTARVFTMRLQPFGAYHLPPLASLSITNHAPYSGPNTWMSQPWPISRTNGGFTLSLVSLETGLRADQSPITRFNAWFVRDQPTGRRMASRARFALRRDGVVVTNSWRIDSMVIEAENGLKWDVTRPSLMLGFSSDIKGNDFILDFRGSLWPDVPVWKVKARVDPDWKWPDGRSQIQAPAEVGSGPEFEFFVKAEVHP